MLETPHAVALISKNTPLRLRIPTMKFIPSSRATLLIPRAGSGQRLDMSINLDRVTAISREVAADVDPRLNVVGVTATEGGGVRVELLVTISGCHAEPCIHLLNVSRAEPDALERDVRAQLQRALASHDAA